MGTGLDYERTRDDSGLLISTTGGKSFSGLMRAGVDRLEFRVFLLYGNIYTDEV